MIAAEEFCDFFRGIVRHILGEGRSVNALQIGLCQQALHHGGVGGQYDVILVHTHGVVAFGLQYAHYAERDFIEPDNASHGVFSTGEKIVYNGFSYHAHLGAGLDIGFAEHLAVVDRELAYLQIVRTHATDG